VQQLSAVKVRRYKKWYARHREAVHCSLLAGLAFLVAVITGQMFYPYGKALPGVSIGGQNVGMQHSTDIAKQLASRYDNLKITIKASTHSYTQPMKNIGMEVVAQPTAQQATAYTLRNRLVPFSFFGSMKRTVAPVMRFDDQRLSEFAAEIAAQNVRRPQDAAITVEGSTAALKPAQTGTAYRIGDIVHALHTLNPATTTTLTLKPVTTQPKRTDAAVRPTLTAAQKIIDTPLSLKIQHDSVPIDKKVLASWIDFKEADGGKTLALTTKEDAVKAYLTDLQSRINKAPGTTQVTIVDGRVTGRTEGMAGFGIDVEKSAKLVVERLPVATEPLTLPLVALPPIAVYNRSYTDTQAGMDAIAKDVAADLGGASLVVIERSGQGRRSEVNANRQWHTASTYKLFIAYAVLKRIDGGQMQWSDPMSYGKDVAGCFESMIVLSDNVCAAAFGDFIGWQTIEGMMHDVGLASTVLASYKSTTANDLALYLTKLEDGTLLPGWARDKLLNAMRRQIYRSGIPLGTGAAVSNKVGYIGGVRHDAGIVYAPNGVYIMVIMTPGDSWPSIAAAARQIHTFLKK
jgi:beta-lactamase class A